MTDWELLRAYGEGSQEAFEELVGRHAGWVYGVAVRGVGDRQLAEDVMQGAFLVLARKGPRLKEGTVVTAWLFRVTRLGALEAARQEGRRRRREKAAAVAEGKVNEPGWEEIAPLLDSMIERLGARDRRAVTLRFFARREFVAIAAELGITEGAARKVVGRAVERLRGMFAEAGVMTSAGVIESVTMSHAVEAHGVQLVGNVLTAAKGIGVAKGTFAGTFSLVAAGMVVVGLCAIFMKGGTTKPVAPQVKSALVIEELRPATRPAGVTLEEVKAGVLAGERAIQNLHIKHFKTTQEVLAAGSGKWVSTPIGYAGSAWYERPGERMRVYFSHEVMAWEDGWAPYADAELDCGFDGKEGRLAWVSSMDRKGKRGPERSGQYNPGKPPMMIADQYSQYGTGRNFALPFIEYQGMHVSNWIVRHAPDICREEMNGFDTVRLSWGSPKERGGWFAIWVVPGKGYASVRYEQITKIPFRPAEWAVTEEMDEVTELKEAAPGVWFPAAARRTMRDYAHPGQYLRYTYRCEEVVANDGKFDPGIFTVKFEPGFVVDSQSGVGGSYIVSGDSTTRPLVIGQAVGRAKVHQIPEP